MELTVLELEEYNLLVGQLVSKIADSNIDEFKVKMAVNAIHNYINHPTNTILDTIKQYDFAVIAVIDEYINSISFKNKFGSGFGVTGISQGGRSITFDSSNNQSGFQISDDLKALLPVPFVSLY